MTNVGFRREVAAWLEAGKLDGRMARLAARYWEKRARPVRPMRLPPASFVVGVGGTTLGGGGKTPVVKELARQLHLRGVNVAVVAPNYRAHPPTAVRVLPHHNVTRMGDEALELCRSLPDVPVYVGKIRERAVALAGRSASVVVVDSLLQTAPVRLGLSILVVDGHEPWGAGACPPLGDLRARRDRLLRATDVLLARSSLEAFRDIVIPARRYTFERDWVAVAPPSGGALPLSELSGKRLGLLTTVARPGRLLRQLGEHGIEVAEWRAGGDHGPLKPRPRPANVDVWVSTAKCRERIGQVFENIPVWVLVEAVTLPEQLVDLVVDKGMIRTSRPVLESAPCSADR